MNYNNITIGIVAFKSEKVIFICLKSIKKIKKIIILDNSNDLDLKKKIKKKFPSVKYVLSRKNIGYAAGNNKIFKLAKTSHVMVLNPDTILNKNCIKLLISQSNQLKENFAIIAPLSQPKNYGYFENQFKKRVKSKNLLQVDYVKGFSMLVNLSKLRKINFFDGNFFLYLEEIDLCKRLKKASEKIFIARKAKVEHLSAQSSNIGFEFEKCRNWHWMWSTVYYNIKNNNFVYALKKAFFKILSNYLKAIFFIFINSKKSIICYLRASGALNALMKRKSWYRPKI